MEDNKRRAYIKQQAVVKEGPKGTGSANPSSKRKPSEKIDCLPKKPKVTPNSVVGLKAKPKKTVTLLG